MLTVFTGALQIFCYAAALQLLWISLYGSLSISVHVVYFHPKCKVKTKKKVANFNQWSKSKSLSVLNLFALFCCALGKDSLRHFSLFSGLGKQFLISVTSLLNYKRTAISWHLRRPTEKRYKYKILKKVSEKFLKKVLKNSQKFLKKVEHPQIFVEHF